MVASEERLRILQMLEEGKISADEAAKLLAAVNEPRREVGQVPLRSADAPGGRGRQFKVRVTDMRTGRTKVAVNMPLGVISGLARFGARFVPHTDDFDVDEVLAAVKAGETGQIVDVMDEEDGEHVEVYIE
jgi:hypothetical protein